jgi:two-component system, NtrC family, sensor kinase
MTTETTRPPRILIIDDNVSIHADIRKVLVQEDAGEENLAVAEAAMFGGLDESAAGSAVYEIDSAHQGQEGLALLRRALAENRPYSMAFVDMRMPPGWDGVETIRHLWAEAPNLQVVICSAYSDHSWSDIVDELAPKDNLLILRKPFDSVEIRQLAHALCAKWAMGRQLELRLSDLQRLVEQRTADLIEANRQLCSEANARARAEIDLRLSQKLEAVGQLASGIAHELNTPIQFVADSVHFLGRAFTDTLGLVQGYRALIAEAAKSHGAATLVARASTLEGAAELAYLQTEIPAACARTIEGTDRVATIVRAMKEFGHPDGREKSSADLDRAITNTLIVASNEYKYVAEIDLSLGGLPPVSCHVGDINQVILNLVVNAAHAIEAVVGNSGTMGRIGIQTRCEGGDAVIEVSDTGCGISPDILDKIYDPFFTTKPVGKGTGQGLAIARSIIVDKHGGKLSVASEVGRGTTFTMHLPIDGSTGARPTV